MMEINSLGYIERKTSSRFNKSGGKATHRSWWLVKWNGTRPNGYICLGKVSVPKEYIGKRIRFKVELFDIKK